MTLKVMAILLPRFTFSNTRVPNEMKRRSLNGRKNGRITAKISKLDIKIFEVGISYNGRKYSDGKKINWKDGFRAIYCIIKYGIFKM